MSDKEEKSIDILGLKPVGEAINTVAKGTMDGVGAFLVEFACPLLKTSAYCLKIKSHITELLT